MVFVEALLSMTTKTLTGPCMMVSDRIDLLLQYN